jgi:L-asparaginase
MVWGGGPPLVVCTPGLIGMVALVPKPRIHLIATGGTIAGTAADSIDTRNYTIGGITADALVASVPPLKDLAEISVEQLYNLDSKDMTPEHWLGLAGATQAALARDDVDGVVITHGTDTMEESALFLDLVLPPGKPVVFTGAMRPATALSADGPMNLLGAVIAASQPAARGLGVMVVMDNCIHAAMYVSKVQSSISGAFSSGMAGIVGTAMPFAIIQTPVRSIDPASLALHPGSTLPRVDILMVGAGSHPALLDCSVASGARGVVLALPGNASVPTAWIESITKARMQGVAVTCSTRVCGIPVPHGKTTVPADLSSSHFPAPKARVALIVALARVDKSYSA